MFGYVVPEKGELKVREYEIYGGYYCGICKSVGRRYGQLPRFALSYDFVFLAVLLEALSGDEEEISREHCILHHIKKKTVVEDTSALRYAGDVMLVMAYYKLLDDYKDDGSIKAGAAAAGLKKTISKIIGNERELCSITEKNLKTLSELEKEKCPQLDKVMEPFAEIMRKIFSNGGSEFGGDNNGLERRAKLLGHIGYHLGKWIYLMDAFEDVQENLDKGTYNPLLYRFEFDEKNESVEDFRNRIKSEVEFNLIQYLAEISNGVDLLDIRKNKGIVENIVYFGLRRKTEQILNIEEKDKEEEKQ